MSEHPMNDERREDNKAGGNMLSRRRFLSYTLGGSGAFLAAGMEGSVHFLEEKATVNAATYGNMND